VITNKVDGYIIQYPQALEFARAQDSIFWTDREITVEKDIQDLKVNMTESEYHGVITVLRLFTLYELFAGSDYWLGRVLQEFPRPEIQRMAATFGHFELGIHAPFYNRINEALHLNTPEFYKSYVNDPTLRSRINFIDEHVNDPDLLVSLGVFSLIEGAVLYSSFAFLKHFQTQGKNKLLNVVRGINFSVRDENLHAQAGAWLFRSVLADREQQLGSIGRIGEHYEKLSETLLGASRAIYDHECRIIDMIFEKGPIEGIDPEDMKKFVGRRIDLCLENLGLEPVYKFTPSNIEGWFYKNINSVTLNDFFTGVGNSYNRLWNEENFKW
jgi:ribonucleoside-diphosphate reductase beta chain